MKNIIKKLAVVVGSVLLVTLILTGVFSDRQVLGSAPAGLPATVATSSIAAVTTNATTVFATSSCAARIITTSASPIMITFSDNHGSVPTGSFGHLQSASTTVAYDSGQYGCGAVKVFSFVAGTISVSESR